LKKRNRELLRKLQMVFQNPEDALNPYLSVGESLSRPLKVMLGLSESEAQTRVQELLRLVQLPADYCYRMPERLSGGEKQRVAIARAFASHPDLLVADEPVSSLDVSIQASILNLLNKIKIDHGTAMLFISHDIAVVGYLADMIAVVYQGSLMEIGPAKQIFRPPQHPYTEVLLSAVPVPDPRVRQATAPSLPDVAEAAATSPGCPFVRRCPHKLGDICSSRNPPKQTHNGKIYFCHIPPPDLERLQTAFSPGEGQKLIPPAGSG
jgi:peptide/nickel transport system ATP-binding protein